MRVDRYIKISRIAHAFLKVNDCDDMPSLDRLRSFYNFIKDRPDIVSILGYVDTVNNAPCSRIDVLSKRFNLKKGDQRLLHFLIEDGKATWIIPVFLKIITEIEKKLGFIRCDIITSHAISADDCSELEAFLQKKLQAKIIPTYGINKDLICGIRVKGEIFVWEYSLANQLHSVITQP